MEPTISFALGTWKMSLDGSHQLQVSQPLWMCRTSVVEPKVSVWPCTSYSSQRYELV